MILRELIHLFSGQLNLYHDAPLAVADRAVQSWWQNMNQAR